MSGNQIQSTLSTVNIAGLRSSISLARMTGTPAVFLGTYGIGKSRVIEQEVAAHGYVMLDYRGGEVDPIEIGGMGVVNRDPFTLGDSGVTVPTSTVRSLSDMATACWAAYGADKRPVCLFLDEITSALPAVQAALYQVMLDKRAGLYPLPPGTLVLAAGNLATDNGLVEELARPLLNRCRVYHYAGPTPDEFKAFMHGAQFHPIIQTALQHDPSFICDKVDPANEQSPTPRSWQAASDLLKTVDRDPAMADFRHTHLCATVGDEAATYLEAYVQIHSKLTPWATIWQDRDKAKVPPSGDFAANYMQTLVVSEGINAHFDQADAAHHTEIAAVGWGYTRRMGEEFRAVYMADSNALRLTALITDLDIQNEIMSSPELGAMVEALTNG